MQKHVVTCFINKTENRTREYVLNRKWCEQAYFHQSFGVKERLIFIPSLNPIRFRFLVPDDLLSKHDDI
uniref:Uncharacterized protein n=1 Tax=Manihot esculenta TaxID=3983 RepID=A0A199UCC1_MANES